MDRTIVFVSTCPSCKRQQPQEGFTETTLRRLLEVGYPIEAYCMICAQFWPITLRERAALANTLSAP
jgi:hypothetical protein